MCEFLALFHLKSYFQELSDVRLPLQLLVDIHLRAFAYRTAMHFIRRALGPLPDGHC